MHLSLRKTPSDLILPMWNIQILENIMQTGSLWFLIGLSVMRPVWRLRWDPHMHVSPQEVFVLMWPMAQGTVATVPQGYEGNPYLDQGCQGPPSIFPSFLWLDLFGLLLHVNSFTCLSGKYQWVRNSIPVSLQRSVSQHRWKLYTCSCPLGSHSDDPFSIPCSQSLNNKIIIGNNIPFPPGPNKIIVFSINAMHSYILSILNLLQDAWRMLLQHIMFCTPWKQNAFDTKIVELTTTVNV